MFNKKACGQSKANSEDRPSIFDLGCEGRSVLNYSLPGTLVIETGRYGFMVVL